MSSRWDLTDRVVLVTGSSRGIGSACAAALVARGARVIVHGRAVDRLDAGVAGLGCKTLQADLAEPGSVDWLADAAREVYGRVDVVVHSAGVGWYGDAAAMPATVPDELLAVNLRAPMQLCAALLPDMLARGTGHLSFVGSIAGLTGVAHEAAYSASKAGLMTFAESLRLELQGSGVGVSVVAPAAVRTEFFARRGAAYGRTFPRPVDPSRIARAVVAGIETDRGDQVVPRWVGVAPIVRALAPPVYRALSLRFG